MGYQQLLTYTTFAASSQLPAGSVTPSSGTGMSPERKYVAGCTWVGNKFSQRVDEIESIARSIPGLHLAGNGYDGIGVPECVDGERSGWPDYFPI